MQPTAPPPPSSLPMLCALALGLGLGLGVSGCSTHQVKRGRPLDERAVWVVLPVQNLAETPLAGERTRALLATLLRMRGIGNLREAVEPETKDPDQLPDLDDQRRYRSALAWAQAQGFAYGVTGTVHEWRYRGAPDGEPAVGLGLEVIELSTGQVVWSAAGALSGWGHDTVSGTAQKLIGSLLSELDLR